MGSEGADIVDVNTRAYDTVKNTWVERGFWNQNWGILPGMCWKHEAPPVNLNEHIYDFHYPTGANSPQTNNHNLEVIPARGIFESRRPSNTAFGFPLPSGANTPKRTILT